MRGTLTHNIQTSNSKGFLDDLRQFKIRLENVCNKYGTSISELSFKFVNDLKGIDKIIFGSRNIKNIKKINQWSKEKLDDNIIQELVELSIDNKFKFIDPRVW